MRVDDTIGMLMAAAFAFIVGLAFTQAGQPIIGIPILFIGCAAVLAIFRRR